MEVEVKLLLPGLDAYRRALSALLREYKLLRSVSQRNCFFDTRDQALRESRSVLRLRHISDLTDLEIALRKAAATDTEGDAVADADAAGDSTSVTTAGHLRAIDDETLLPFQGNFPITKSVCTMKSDASLLNGVLQCSEHEQAISGTAAQHLDAIYHHRPTNQNADPISIWKRDVFSRFQIAGPSESDTESHPKAVDPVYPAPVRRVLEAIGLVVPLDSTPVQSTADPSTTDPSPVVHRACPRALQLVGEFSTLRHAFHWPFPLGEDRYTPLKLEFDATKYSFGTVYEIEIEAAPEIVMNVRAALSQWLGQHNIEFRDSQQTKLGRFVKGHIEETERS